MKNEYRIQMIKDAHAKVKANKLESFGECFEPTEEDIKEEVKELQTRVEYLTQEQDSLKWQNQFMQDLVFGS